MTAAKTILIVEDDPLVGLDLSQALRSFGYDVIGPITSGEEVLKVAPNITPDLILMDVNLKGKLDGVDTAAKLPANIEAPVVFLTADTDEQTLQRAMLTRPYGYLIKPFDPVELRSTIEVSLQRFEEALTSDVPEVADAESQAWGVAIRSDAPLSDRAAILGQMPLFAGLSPDDLERVAGGCSVRQHEAGEMLVTEGSESESIFIPLSGRVSITKSAESGKELIVALLGPGDVFGLFYFVPSFAGSTSARAQISARVLWMPKSIFASLVAQRPSVLAELLDSVAARLVHSHELSSGLAHARVEDRIITMLIALLKEFGKASAGPNEGRIYITRRELADMTGTTPETAIRATKNLEREGLLDLTKPGIIKIPNIAKLREVRAGDR